MLRGHKKDQEEQFFSDLEASHDNMVVAAPGPSGQGVEGRHALWPELGIFAILNQADFCATSMETVERSAGLLILWVRHQCVPPSCHFHNTVSYVVCHTRIISYHIIISLYLSY